VRLPVGQQKRGTGEDVRIAVTSTMRPPIKAQKLRRPWGKTPKLPSTTSQRSGLRERTKVGRQKNGGSDYNRKRQLDRPAGIMGLQEIEKKVWHLSALGAALPQLVGYVVGDIAHRC
jgi:hypothetical protein